MKIVVLNGSPKGSVSVTMTYVNYLERRFPEHQIVYVNISQKIKQLEKSELAIGAVFDEIDSADGILWAFPLYVYMVPSQYKRFIELVFEWGKVSVFNEKHAAILTTSIHFFDHTAHNYMEGICNDFGMQFVGSFSSEMNDLKKPVMRQQLEYFYTDFLDAIQKNRKQPKRFPPVNNRSIAYQPGSPQTRLRTDKKVVVLTDCYDPASNQGKMIEQFSRCLTENVEVVNLSSLKIKGGCLGCLQCGYDNVCSYSGSDEFREFYLSSIERADVLVCAGTIKDRFLSSTWKQYFDRRFFKTHAPFLGGTQIGFLISGPLSDLPNLREILEADTQIVQANCVGFVSDESADSKEIDSYIANLADALIKQSEAGYLKPPTFLGVGGQKVFRDDIFGKIRFPFVSDHKRYRQEGLYDFPQKRLKVRLNNAILMTLCKLPGFRKEVYKKRIKPEMVASLQRIVESIPVKELNINQEKPVRSLLN